MPSRAATTFALRTGDIDRLLRIHADIAGRSAGRKYGVEVLNRSAIVLLTAMWEGYIEDVSAEALTHLVDNTSDPATLPLGLRQGVARELKADPMTCRCGSWQVWVGERTSEGAWPAMLTSGRAVSTRQDRSGWRSFWPPPLVCLT